MPPVRQPAHKNDVSFYLPLDILFHFDPPGVFITFPFNNTCLSTEWGVISFCLYIYFGLTANQITHSLKSLPLFYGYVRPSRPISGLYPTGFVQETRHENQGFSTSNKFFQNNYLLIDSDFNRAPQNWECHKLGTLWNYIEFFHWNLYWIYRKFKDF